MLDIFICSEDSADNSLLKDLCFNYLMAANYEAEVYYYAENRITSFASIYMMYPNSECEEMSRKLRRINRENYIVVLLEKADDFRKAVTPGISPSGLLVKPWNKADVKMLLDELYTDYQKCCESSIKSDMFRFRQKSREFSVPYNRILYFESRSKKIHIRTDSQEFEFYDTLDSIEKDAPDYFMKIHKSFVVNLSRIVFADYGNMTVEFDDGSAAYMSRTFKGELKKRIGERGEERDNLIYNR